MDSSEEKTIPEESKEDLIKNSDIYKGLEAMVSLQVSELSELIAKGKSAKTKTSKKLYEKKIEKKREKILKYLFQLDKLTKGKVQDVLEELENDNNDLKVEEGDTE